MDTILDIIIKRMSIRAYQNKPLPEDTIRAILEAAKNAPTARNMQELEYKVITNPALINKLSDRIGVILSQEMAAQPARPGMPTPPERLQIFYKAPLLIIITGPEDNSYIYTDAALAVQNIMLYATAQNLGSCFIGMATLIEKDRSLMKELHCGDKMKIAAAVIAGYPNETPVPKTKTLKAEYFK
jgi:nitroreductase